MKKLGAFVVFLCVLASSPAWAQVNTAQINGTVSDASGAVVPNAQITVTNPATGFSRATQSNETGNFAVALLPPATYTLKVELQGFQTTLQKDIVLAVGQQLTLSLTLQAGAITQTVEVTGEAPLVELTRSEIAGSLSALEIKEFPIIDRNFAGLTYFIPGVRPAEGFDPTKSRVGNMSLNGGDGRQFDVNVDGADNKDNVVGGLIQNFTLEGIQEFNVITNRYTAESGRTVAGIINVVTKSGTNEFHGSVFGLFQVSTFNRKSFFERDLGPDGFIGTADDCVSAPNDICPGTDGVLGTLDDVHVAKRKFHRYHFGFSAGGPVIKDKLFAFGAYEHKREPGAIPVEPNAFSELALFPLAVPISQLPFDYLDHLLTIKIDHRLTDRHNLSYRYGRQRWTQPNDQLGAPFIADASQTTNNVNQFHDFNIQHNYAFSPTKVNSFNVHFQDMVNQIVADPERTFTLAVAGGGTATNPNIIFPSAEIGNNVNVPQQTLIRKYQFRDDFAWTYNRHNMKFGANYIYLAKLGGSFFFGANGYQVFFWDDASTILSSPDYPQGFATPGAVREIDFSGGTGDFKQRPHALTFYFQDDFKVTPRLTLNLGLRWDANIDFLPRQLGDDPATNTDDNRTIAIFRQVVAANPAGPGAQEGLASLRSIVDNEGDLRRTTASWTQFQPRLGFAWDPTGRGKHVIRGGYGISFDQVFQNLTLFALQQSNPTIYQTIIALADSTPPPTPTGPLATFRFGVDPLPAPAPGITDLEFGGFGRINDPNGYGDPYAQQWSLGWAWEFRPDWAFSVDYYHVLAIHEPRVININPRIREVCDALFPTANPADPRCVRGVDTRFLDAAFEAAGVGAGRLEQTNMIGTTNRSRFDSVNFVLRKRLSHNFMMNAHYILSWSRSWGGRPTASYSGNGIAITTDHQFLPGEFGPTIFDERHRFVWSGHFQLPYGIEITPIFQAASARPFNFTTGRDTDGDGRSTIDRVCEGSTVDVPIIAEGCQQVRINALRGDPFAQLDVRFGKAFRFHQERLALRLYWEFYNLFDTNNFGNNFGNNASAPSTFDQPLGYFGGQGFGGATSGPLRSQFGFRLEW